MANDTYSKSLGLNDKVSPVLQKIMKSLEATQKAMEQMDKAANKGISSDAYKEMTRNIEQANKALGQLGDEQERVTKETKNWHTGIISVTAALHLARAAMQQLQGFANIADEFTLTTARLNLMNDGLQTTAALQQQIFDSAQRARASYTATASLISRLGMQAGEAFGSNADLIRFAELLNKSFINAGTSAAGMESTLYNLTQALSSGVLRGQDLRVVMENAMPVVQNIADYLGVSVGEIRNLAAEGALSADVVREALFAAADDIEAQFQQMPKTFAQVMTSIQNQALMKLQPVIEKFSEIINNPAFEAGIMGIVNAIGAVANGALVVVGVIQDNWPAVRAILYMLIGMIGIQLTQSLQKAVIGFFLVQEGAEASAFASMMAWLKTNWTMLAIVATISILISYWGELGQTGQIVGLAIVGVLLLVQLAMWGVSAPMLAVIGIFMALAVAAYYFGDVIAAVIATVAGVFAWLYTGVQNIMIGFANAFLQVSAFFANAFGDAIYNVELGFYNFRVFALQVFAGIARGIQGVLDYTLGGISNIINSALSGVNWVIDALNKIPGVDIASTGSFDFSTRGDWGASFDAMMAELEAPVERKYKHATTIDYLDQGDAFGSVYGSVYDGAQGLLGKYQSGINDLLGLTDGKATSNDNIAAGLTDITSAIEDNALGADSTIGSIGKINNPITLDEEDIKLMLDVSKARTINRFSTLRPSVNATFGDVRETADVDAILDALVYMMEEAEAAHMLTES
ncbi:tape measure protein [Ruminococcaceae bacterium OttesenSCG-928-N02]|nr:tape measure protein [Ruminococcaceae bacterium OttesenSCG-928-N02]